MATAQDVITRVRDLINDSPSAFVNVTRWSDEELLRWITDAQRQVAKLHPESYAITDVFLVEDGVPRQRIDPAQATALIRVEANTPSEGSGGAADTAVHFLPGSMVQDTVTSNFVDIDINYDFAYNPETHPRGAIVVVVAFQLEADIGSDEVIALLNMGLTPEANSGAVMVGPAGFGSSYQYLCAFMFRVDSVPVDGAPLRITWQYLPDGTVCKYTAFMMYNVGNVSDSNISGELAAYAGQGETTEPGALLLSEGFAIVGGSVQYTGGDVGNELISVVDDTLYTNLGAGTTELTSIGDGHYYRAAYREFATVPTNPYAEVVAPDNTDEFSAICLLRLSPNDV